MLIALARLALTVLVLVAGWPASAPAAERPSAPRNRAASAAQEEADRAYADRENPASARQALEIWTREAAARPDDVEPLWKMARAFYWLGTNGPDDADAKKRLLEEGVTTARRVVALAPSRPEGHFWAAANMGALAESHGLRAGLRYRGDIKRSLEAVLKIDPAFMDGSADRALGRWYYKVPRLFGGNMRRSEEHLRKALAYNPQSIITQLFLAETLMELDRDDEARRALEAALAAPVDPDWAPEDRRFQQRARALLAAMT